MALAVLNRSAKSGHFCLFILLEEKPSVFCHFTYDVSCGLFIYGLHHIEVIYFLFLVC